MIQSFQNHMPALHPTVRVADNATVVGDVALDAQANVWYGAVLRGDEAAIRVGAGSNIQDNAVIHCDEGYPTSIGRDVTVGHGAIVHGCTVADGCLIGMGAILLTGCTIGAGSLVGAGALVTQGVSIPPGSLVLGSPAKVVRPLRPEEAEELTGSAENYRQLAARQLPVWESAKQGGNA